MLVRFLSLFGLLLGVGAASAEITAKPIEYKHETTTLEGLVVQDEAVKTKRPVVILIHELGASSAQGKARAGQIAKMGYVVFVADLYGKGATPKDGKDAVTKLGFAKDRKLALARAQAGFITANKLPNADTKKIAVVGFGIGGSLAIDLCRHGAEIEGAVNIHGDLIATPGGDAKKIAASVYVVLGADDPAVPLTQVGTFEDEMRKSGVDSQVLRMGGLVGDFTNPQAGRDLKTGRAYDADGEERAMFAIKAFLFETFPPEKAKPVEPKKGTPAPKEIPDKVMKVLEFVDKNGEAMDNYEGGRNFGNFEKRLPQTDDKARRIRYREWDVNPLKPGVNRGAERLVTGSDGSAYYTKDHYDSFIKIR